MALAKADLEMWKDLCAAGLVPLTPRVLEIGQANWYGDVEPPEDCKDDCLFTVARNWYKKTLNYRSIVSIDMNGRDALKYDLNDPLPLAGMFDVVINTGTAEHVFDQRQLMTSIHECCEVGGLMIHAAPWQGWEEHGFYCYQPCFFRDLAKANDYGMLYFASWNFNENSMMYVAMRKLRMGAFKVPRQGKYDSKRGGSSADSQTVSMES